MIYKRFAVLASCFVFISILISGRVEALIQLKKFNVSVNTITTSGVSAGGYMAVQLHVAHSKTIKGAAVFAGGPWFCAQANLAIAEEECMDYYANGPNVKYLVDLTISQALLGGVDDPVNMKSHSVYLFGGVEDSVIDPRVVQALESYYKSFVSHANIVGNYHEAAEHCMPTVDYGVNCETLASPYIGNCAFDGAGEGLKTLYGTGFKKGNYIPSNLFEFDQTPYITSYRDALDKVGFIYIPTACQDGKAECKLHISFHGCLQNRALIGDAYAVHAGYNAWAEANDMIVLYPYVVQSQANPFNPNGCWDWWGYTDAFYSLKTGMQVRSVTKMISTITGLVMK